MGTLSDFSKVNNLFNALGDNIQTDMEGWEMKRAWELSGTLNGNPNTAQRVLDTTEEGLLYHPENTPHEIGYILLPQGDNYDRIHALFQNPWK